jgi:hypothetical protein
MGETRWKTVTFVGQVRGTARVPVGDDPAEDVVCDQIVWDTSNVQLVGVEASREDPVAPRARPEPCPVEGAGGCSDPTHERCAEQSEVVPVHRYRFEVPGE